MPFSKAIMVHSYLKPLNFEENSKLPVTGGNLQCRIRLVLKNFLQQYMELGLSADAGNITE
jgi:hypothetical protein